MEYDFKTEIERRGTGCVKWDLAPEGVIPMWVADMDFKTAPFIMDALRKRLEHGVFGYVHPLDSYYKAVIDWFGKRRGWTIEKDWIIYIPGLVPALSVAVKAFCEPGDKVLFNSPAYNCFFSSVRNNGCEIVTSHLVRKGTTFCVDWDDMEAKLADPKCKLFILCNPHNPTGRVWTKEELVKFGELCRRNNVIVVSDEIHCEIEMPGHTYIPFASVSRENLECSVSFNSPSKAFNLAGLQISNIVCSNSEWREKLNRTININEVCDVNPFGPVALEAAYTAAGEEWLSCMNAVVWRNWCALKSALAARLPQLTLCDLEGTYLAWLDCSAITAKGMTVVDVQKSLTDNEKVWINNGSMYGDDNYMRINLATQPSVADEGIARIVKGLERITSALR